MPQKIRLPGVRFSQSVWKVAWFSLILGGCFWQGFSQVRQTSLPQFAAGGSWECDQFFTNQGASPVANVAINYYDRTGGPLSVNSTSGSGNSFTFNLGLGETRVIRFLGTGALTTGYCVVQTPWDASVQVTEVLRYEAGGVVYAEIGVPQQDASTLFTFPAEVWTSRRTSACLAVAYPVFGAVAPPAQSLVVSLIRSDGTLQATKVIETAPGSYWAAYLNEPQLFPGLDNFTGSVCIAGVQDFAVLPLRQDKDAVGAVAVDNRPVVGPFLATSAPVNETEPNNTRTQAQFLQSSTLVAGVVSTPADLDYTRFSGKQGDLVSFYATTEGLGSNLWPFIVLETGDGAELARNNNAGFPDAAAFIQTVLPADGTYYLRVAALFGAGAAGLYRLHALVPTSVGPPPPPPAPFVSNLAPVSGLQGSVLTMFLVGSNLTGVTSLSFSPAAGIVANIVAGGENHIEAALTIAPGAAIGAREVKANGPGGASTGLTFNVLAAGSSFQADGAWSGLTSQGLAVSFTVSGGKVTRLSYRATVIGAGCTTTTEATVSGTLATITNGVFTYAPPPIPGQATLRFFGAIGSNNNASGWLTLTTATGCVGATAATWTATKP